MIRISEMADVCNEEVFLKNGNKKAHLNLGEIDNIIF